MRRLIGFTLTAVIVAGLGVSSLAGTRTPRINRRQENQQERIQQGVRSGELTRSEAVRAERLQGRIQADKLIAKRDGNVSPRERARLERQLDYASREIYRLKHNERERQPLP